MSRVRTAFLAFVCCLAVASTAFAEIPEAVPDLPVLTAQTRVGTIVRSAAAPVTPTAKTVDGDPSDWAGDITRLGGTAIYSKGEYVYQDYLGDAWGADDGFDAGRLEVLDAAVAAEPRTYRADVLQQAAGAQFGAPQPVGAALHYGDVNASDDVRTQADIEEVRVAADATDLYVLVRTLNMQDVARTAVVVSVDTQPGGSYRSFGGITTAAEWSFLTSSTKLLGVMHEGIAVLMGCQLPCDDLPFAVASSSQGFTNAVEIRLARSLMPDLPANPGIGIATGLTSADPNVRGLVDVRAGDAKSSLVNVAFRTEPARIWMDKRQALALRTGDIDAFLQTIDLGRLAGGATETFTQTPGYFEGVYVVDSPANEERLVNAYFQGPYQHYGIYLPESYRPGSRYSAMFWMHYRGGHAHDAAAWEPGILRQFGDETGSIVVTPSARGESSWYTGRGMLDYMKVWDTVMGAHSIEPDRVYLGGHSMGGWASWLLGLTMPDRWAASNPQDGLLAPGLWTGVGAPTGGQNGQDVNAEFLMNIIGNARNLPYAILHGTADELVPVTSAVAAGAKLHELGYRYRTYLFHAYEHYSAPIWDEWREMARYMWSFRRDANPARVSYATWPALERAVSTINTSGNDLGFRFNGAYWVSGMETRTPGTDPANIGRVDATSKGVGVPNVIALPEIGPCWQTAPCTMHGQRWLGNGSGAWENSFSATVTNLREVQFDVARMGLETVELLSADLKSDGPVEVRLAGSWSSAPQIDGASAIFEGGVVTLQIPEGITHVEIRP